jgi:hypothetical protein
MYINYKNLNCNIGRWKMWKRQNFLLSTLLDCRKWWIWTELLRWICYSVCKFSDGGPICRGISCKDTSEQTTICKADIFAKRLFSRGQFVQ